MWITVRQYQARHRDGQRQDALVGFTNHGLWKMALVEYTQHPIADARSLKLELVETVALEEHEVCRPQIS